MLDMIIRPIRVKHSFINFVCMACSRALPVAAVTVEIALAKTIGDNQTEATGDNPASELLLDADPRLAKALGRALSLNELKTWAGLPEPRRAKALQRITALDRYRAEGSELSAKQAAMEAGVKLGRFYQMARAWSANRSLESLGAYVSATKPRSSLKPHVNQALMAVVKQVVEAQSNQGNSIATLAKKLGAASNLPAKDVPSANTLRAFIEREQRRRRNTKLAGTQVLFDLSATSLLRDDGRPHVAFLAIDDGTGLILGHAIGLAEESRAGYQAAAQNSLSRILAALRAKTIWSETMERSQIVPGVDAPAIASMSSRIKGEIGGAAPQLTAEDKQGGYIRRHTGLKLGSIRMLPSRTGAAPSAMKMTKGGELNVTDAFARMEVAVTEHNAGLLLKLAIEGDAAPPGKLIRMLEMIAAA
ncbi:hypothetical protein OKW76_12100 [Sphingomonas sp. S1-29]|uniref:hypothetical protein n=1 Tax=Sphingomonas sp. S1-29 TaxID=2991074 RepID=UPI0022405DF8|nr:hypothetical protein [Sphingomonas sp. S1-29]UZK68776.1 hypothetical protein OKW76_12100 [Sphingomonas sp. S1-29]